MKLDKKGREMVSKYSIYGAVIAVVLAGVGATGNDIWLASTQWLLIALVLIAFAIYLRIK